jgi:OPA family glycerol-3-phosphate transporter-like MFS transporter
VSDPVIAHSAAYRRRRFLNWFPMGLTYAFLYMGRYNLTVAKNALGDLMTKEDFGLIFGIGTFVYALSFLVNGPVTDKLGGKKAILAAALGSGVMNLLMGLFVRSTLVTPGALALDMTTTLAVLYAVNMYFQSAAAVAIVKVNASWFHVRERGGFSGIFGTMISSGIFFAFTVNGWVLDWTSHLGPGGKGAPWWVFLVPSLLLLTFFVVEFVLLRDRPSQAGFQDFDTGDASSGEGEDVRLRDIVRRVLTNPIILTVALIEFCTGVLRNGVMHWFPIYAKEVWALPSRHPLRDGDWTHWWMILAMFAVAAVLFVLGSRARSGRRKATLIVSGALVALAPFLGAGWGGLLFVAGVIGGNVAGWVSDLFFQSRRAPAAGGLYLLLTVCVVIMIFALGGTTTRVGWVGSDRLPLREGDRVVSVADRVDLATWSDVSRAFACVPAACQGDGVSWDTTRCLCTSSPETTAPGLATSGGTIPFGIERDGARVVLDVPDPLTTGRAGDARRLSAGPTLTLTPFLLGVLMFLISLGVIGTHGLLSGTATMDFGGRKGAATAVGMIDGFVYLGTAVQSVSLGYLTTRNWQWWPLFLLPFAIIGFVLLLRIWNAKPRGAGGH